VFVGFLTLIYDAIHLNTALIVLDCTPMVEGVELMLDELNRSNNFSAFVQQARAKFRDHALRGDDFE
jgi:hypothetical protein